MKTIGVLTSGGDAPGMNAVVRAVVRGALSKNMRVLGIERGYNGLLHNEITEMHRTSVSDIIQRGGTILYTARCLEFKEKEGIEQAKQNCIKLGLEGIVVIGGDGSFRGAKDLSEAGIPCIGIPGTIDNDIACTEYTIGYDTAMNTAIEMVDKIRDTAQSHDRCSVVEVMGRHAGYIAVNVGLAVGATDVMTVERPISVEKIINKIHELQESSKKKHFIIIVSEGIGGSYEIANQIEKATGIETRATILGHVQRGGSPTLRDRVIGTQMGYRAVELLEQGIGNRVIALKEGKLIDYDIFEALNMKKPYVDDLHNMLEELAL
jgi:6-phosphofructokinase 1